MYRFVDGASGWDLNDHIAGRTRCCATPRGGSRPSAFLGMELTAAGAAKIAGLTELMGPTGFNKDLADPPFPFKGVGFMGGDILLGGRGSDLLEGKGGDDLIDGDLWLNVQLRAVLNDGTVKLVDSLRDLIDDIFADPQRLNPGNITIVKSIVTPRGCRHRLRRSGAAPTATRPCSSSRRPTTPSCPRRTASVPSRTFRPLRRSPRIATAPTRCGTSSSCGSADGMTSTAPGVGGGSTRCRCRTWSA